MSRDPLEGTAGVETLSRVVWTSAQYRGDRASRKMLSGYCHQCRNALNGIKLGLYLVKRANGKMRPSHWDGVEANYLAIETYFDRLQNIYQPIALLPIKADLGRWLGDREKVWQDTLSRTGRSFVLDAPSESVIGEFDLHQFGQAFDGFVSWRATASSQGGDARLAWGQDEDSLILEWREEGRGSASRLLDHGPLEEPDHANEHGSLAFLVLKQVVAAHGGTCRCTVDEDFRVTLRWPKGKSSQ